MPDGTRVVICKNWSVNIKGALTVSVSNLQEKKNHKILRQFHADPRTSTCGNSIPLTKSSESISLQWGYSILSRYGEGKRWVFLDNELVVCVCCSFRHVWSLQGNFITFVRWVKYLQLQSYFTARFSWLQLTMSELEEIIRNAAKSAKRHSTSSQYGSKTFCIEILEPYLVLLGLQWAQSITSICSHACPKKNSLVCISV